VNSIKSIASKDAQAIGLGFTDIKIAESCTLCNACVEKCPHQALGIKEGELMFHDDLCTGCGYCQEICPEHSIALFEKTGNLTLGIRAVYKDEMIACSKCKTPYVSSKMVAKVAGTLQTDRRVFDLCPNCRQTEIYQNLLSSINPNVGDQRISGTFHSKSNDATK
jgi:Pyruvate/2-oxoacid:ferredoxin oxidoreductase delta subunit